jgi:D-alanine-D-alanine ligase
VELHDKTIAVLMGGVSSEREVSLRSGANCLRALESLGYRVVAVDAQPDVAVQLARVGAEVAFLALHGRYGEDGTIQGLLEILGIPYTGSGVLASALAMNKVACKKVVEQSGIPTPLYREVDRRTPAEDLAASMERELGYPLILKPVQEGSSVGVVKISSPGILADAVERGRREFGSVFVERCVEGAEITVGVLEADDEPFALPILELVPKNEFYDYEAKYTDGMTEFIIPARLAPDVYGEAQRLACRVFDAVGCRGYCRVDFMVDRDGVPQFTEVNTLPGMTDLSDLPAQAKHAGISYEELVEMILRTAGLDADRLGGVPAAP